MFPFPFPFSVMKLWEPWGEDDGLTQPLGAGRGTLGSQLLLCWQTQLSYWLSKIGE